MWTKLLIGFSVAVFHLMSVVNCTFGPYFPVGQHLQKCPSGGYSKIRCRPDLKFNDCGPGFECIRKPQLLPFDMIFCGVCCPSKRKCPVGILQGPYCSYGSKCPRGFSCQNGACCKMKRPTCPTGSVSGQKCSLLFPCKPGNICIKGTCCSLPNKQTLPKSRPVCPKNYSPLAGVKCRVHSQCQGHAVCFYNTCCHPDKRRFPLKQPPVPPTSTVRRPPSAVPTMLPRGTVPPTKTPRKIPQTRPPVFIAPPPRPKAPPSRTRPPIMLTQAPIRPDTLSPPVRKAFCPSGLRELPGLTCDHILGCPGTSQCISGLCCAKQGDGKRRQCPADHTLIPDVNCELRQHCPLNSYCISGLCCRPKPQPTLGPSVIPSPQPCPENYSQSTDQQCTLSTCPGIDICVSGICCTKIKQHDIGMLPPICPVGYKQVTNRLCQTDVSCPLESLCIHGHCCRYVYPPTKPPSMIPTPGPKNLQPGRTTPQVPPSCPPGNISIPGLSCDHIYLCPAGSQCISGICCLSFNTVKVPACPIDFLSADPCPNPREPDQCTLDTDCGPFMICCLTSCDRRVCKPIVSPKPSRPRK